MPFSEEDKQFIRATIAASTERLRTDFGADMNRLFDQYEKVATDTTAIRKDLALDQARQRAQAATLYALESRVDDINDRLKKLEPSQQH